MKKRFRILLVLFFVLPGSFLLFRVLTLDQHFMIITTRTGDFPEYDNIIEVVNDFGYDAELDLSWNDYPHKMSNYCSPAFFEELTAGVLENRKNLWWKPFYSNFIRHRMDLDFLNSFIISCDEDLFRVREDNHNQYTINEPHFFINNSYLPDILTRYFNETTGYFDETTASLSNIYVMSLDLLYDIGDGIGQASGYSMEQKVFLSADFDVIAVFVYEMWQIVA